MEEQTKKEIEQKPVMLMKLGKETIPIVSLQFIRSFLHELSLSGTYTLVEISTNENKLLAIDSRIQSLDQYLTNEAEKLLEQNKIVQ